MLGSVVFYVGHGRDRRDTDRIRYVKRQIERKRQGLPVHWHLSIEVLAKLIEEGFEDQVRIRRAPEGITKRQAKIAERLLIDRLIGRLSFSQPPWGRVRACYCLRRHAISASRGTWQTAPGPSSKICGSSQPPPAQQRTRISKPGLKFQTELTARSYRKC